MGVLDAVLDGVAANPALTVIVVVLLALVFGAYLFLRRIATNVAEGYDEGRRS